MTIYIDGDSCPQQVRSIVYRACKRRGLSCVQVANRPNPGPPFVSMVVVDKAPGAADRHIVDRAVSSDLVITRDIPLAEELLAAGVTVINDRGDEFEVDTIRERLSLRDTMEEFRLHGILGASDKRFGPKETKAFADCFDRVLRRLSDRNE